jgi:hypothetical protein
VPPNSLSLTRHMAGREGMKMFVIVFAMLTIQSIFNLYLLGRLHRIEQTAGNKGATT